MDFVKGDLTCRRVLVFSGRFGVLDVQSFNQINCYVHILSFVNLFSYQWKVTSAS